MKRLLWIFILLPMLVQAEPRLESISRFAGLNTAVSDIDRQPNAAITSINADYSLYGIGTFGVRKGYDSVSFLNGQDEIIGIDAIYLSDYRQYLGIVTDSAGVGYGNIYASPYGEAHFTGSNLHAVFFRTHNSVKYADTVIIGADTTEITYTSDGSAIASEIVSGMVDAWNASHFYDDSIFAAPVLGIDSIYLVIENTEFLNATYLWDTTKTVDTISFTSTRIWSPYSTQNKPSFAQFNDEWFIVNGAQKGVRYNGKIARSWPPNAPGEPSIIPLSDDGPMDGEYVYTFRAGGSIDIDSAGSIGYVSAPIRVKSGQVMMKNFGFTAADTTDATPDTLVIWAYRSKANPGTIDEGDYAFFLDTIAIIEIGTDDLAAVIYIDSISDNGLSTTDSVKLVQNDWIGRDSLGVIDVRYGAPGFLDIPVWVTVPTNSMFKGIPEQQDTLGVAYLLTFIDTVNGDESGGGAVSAVWVDSDSTSWDGAKGGGKPAHIRMALPSLPDTGLVYNLYRAHILQITYDSIFQDTVVPWTGDKIVFRRLGWQSELAVDTTILSEFRLVAQISADSSAFTDSVNYDSLQLSQVYRGAIPPLLSGIFSHNNFLYGWDGSFLAWSDLDSAGNWGAFQRQSVNRDDGDAITVAFATRLGVRILKNYTNYTLYDDNSKLEKVGDWGCIAPRSYAAADNGHFYLSARGVVFETEGLQLERTVVSGLVSKKLRNFDLLSIETKREAVGRWYPTEGKYWLTINDTNYVYDKRASDLLGEEVWGIWAGMVFTDGTLYNTEDVLAFLPGSDFYFIQDGSSNLFRYGFSDTDPRSTPIAMEWENANMFADPGWKSEITAVAIRGFSDSASDILLMTLRDETGAATQSNVQFDSLNQYYRARKIGYNLALEHGIELKSNPPTYPFQGGRVERLDIWYEPRVEPIIQR